MSDSTGEATSGGAPGSALNWHEVVHSEQFSEPVSGPIRPGWTWRYTWNVVRYSVMPLLVTALALTTVLLTLIGLVARPFPWSPQPLFGGALPHSRVETPSTDPSKAPGAVRTGADARTTVGAAPDPQASAAGSGALATPTALPTGARPSGSPAPAPGVGVTVAAEIPPLLPTGILALPTIGVSVPVSLPVQLPLPTITVAPSLPVQLPVPLPKLTLVLP